MIHMYNNIIIFLAEYLQYILLVLLFIYGIYGYNSQNKLNNLNKYITVAIALFSAIIARFGLKEILIRIFPEARPYVADSNLIPIIGPQIGEEMQSFPSGHAIFYFAIATIVYIQNKRLGIIFYIGAILMGVGRVLSNVHYTNDIVAGAIIGSITAFVINYIYYRNFNSKVKEVIRNYIK